MTYSAKSELDELIEQERKRAAKKIAKLKRAAAAEQRRIDEKVVAFLREQDAHLYDQLVGEVRVDLADERAKRSRRPKESGSLIPTDSAHHVSRDDEHGGEARDSW